MNLFNQRSVQIALGAWLASILLVILLGRGGLPFDRPLLAGRSFAEQLINAHVQLADAVFLIGVIYLMTRRRPLPDLQNRAPSRASSIREMLLSLGYGIVVLVTGQAGGRIVGSHGIGLHLHGTIYGPTATVSQRDVLAWVVFNFVFWALVPYLYFRKRGYSHEALNLKSSDVKNDSLLILVVLVLEALGELSISKVLDLSGRQVVLGGSLSFVIHLFGTVLPVMVFVYCILLPRYFKLSRSVATTTLLGGLTYAGMHLFEYWAVYGSIRDVILSLIFVAFQFFGPGMVKSYLTLRTGNAWVHVWAYHAIAPHVTTDTANIVKVFGIR